jgi:hypothetical protein
LVRIISGPAYQFDGLSDMAVVGADLFVSNALPTSPGGVGDSVTEINISTGALVRVISAPAYGFDNPDVMAVHGTDLFVANGLGASVTELNASTGALVRVIYGFNYPVDMALAGDDLFVLSNQGDSVTEVNASTGALVKVISSSAYQLVAPRVMAVSRDDLFVAHLTEDGDANAVTEINVATGALVRILSGPAYKFSDPSSMVAVGGDLFVANYTGYRSPLLNAAGDSVTEVNASTGALVKVISAPRYSLDSPDSMAVLGDNLFVANSGGNSVTELNASTGALVRVISAPRYRFDDPGTLVLAGGDMFVASSVPDNRLVTTTTNPGGASCWVTELSV